MLVLERKEGEGLWIGRNIRIEIREIRNRNRVKISVIAPREVSVLRDELSPTAASANGVRAGRVWLVDDNETNREMIRSALTTFGVDELSIFESGDEVLLAAGAVEEGCLAKPNLILLDHEMPGMTGAEVLKRLRSFDSLAITPTLMLSGYTDPSAVEQTLRNGANAFVQKADTFDEMVESIRTVVGFWASNRRLQPGAGAGAGVGVGAGAGAEAGAAHGPQAGSSVGEEDPGAAG